MAYGIIYKATNIVNGKVYIGQTINGMSVRQKTHIQESKENPYNKHFASAIKKYGKENFIWEEIDEASSKEELDEKEIYWIWLNNSTDNKLRYNRSIGGHSHQRIDVVYATILLYEGMLIKEICQKLNCDRSSLIRRFMFHLGKKKYLDKVKENRRNRPRQHKYSIPKDQFIFYLKKGMSFNQIAKELKISKIVVKSHIVKYFGKDFYESISIKNRKLTTQFSKNSSAKRVKDKLGDIKNLLLRWENGEALKKIAKTLKTDYVYIKREIIKLIGEDEYKRRSYLNSRHQKVVK